MTIGKTLFVLDKMAQLRKKCNIYLLEYLFSDELKKLLNEGKAGKKKAKIDPIPEIRKYVQGGGPLYITGNTEFKVKNKHGIDDAISAAIKTLKNHNFVTRYQKGILNFYRRYKNDFGGTSYMLVGVDVRSKEIKTVYNIFRSVYKRDEKKKLNQ